MPQTGKPRGSMGRSRCAAMPLVVLASLMTVTHGDVALASTRWLGRGRALQQTTPLPAPTACTFTGSKLVTDAFLESFGLVAVTPQAALECINKIKVDYRFAYGSVDDLATVFNNSYPFVAMAANPTSGVPLSLTVYDLPVNVPEELYAMADAWPRNRPVPLGDLNFGVSDIFNRLYDAHVTWQGQGQESGGAALGNVLSNLTLSLLLLDMTRPALMSELYVTQPARDGAIVVSARFLDPNAQETTRVFRTINGTNPFAYFLALANNPVLSLPFKAAATRLNQLLGTGIQAQSATNLGRLSRLPPAVGVVYTDGSRGTLQCAITFRSRTVSAARLQALQRAANTPGIPARALQAAIDVLTRQTANISAVSDLVSESTRRKAAEALPSPTRRVLQATNATSAVLNVQLNYLNNSDGSGYYGYWFINRTADGSRVAVLKVTIFTFEPSLMTTWWPELTSAAAKEGASSLVLDLTGNGGGYSVARAALTLALFPRATYADFGFTYDAIIGADAVFAYQAGLHPDDVNATLRAFTSNRTWVQEAVDYLNADASRIAELRQLTKAVVTALDVLFNSSSAGQTQICFSFFKNETEPCAAQWQIASRVISSNVDVLASDGQKLGADTFGLFLQGLVPALRALWPYTGTLSSERPKDVDPYRSPRLINRGGIWRNYTAPFDLIGYPPNTTVVDLIPTVTSTKPVFTKILALSNGFCGSACGVFSRTAWFYSRRNPTAPVFKFLTFGGTGQAEDADPTSFPGGNVNTNDYITSSWGYYALGKLLAAWTGADEYFSIFDKWAELLPGPPGFLDQFTPRYTQNEILFTKYLGQDSEPTEYMKHPTDYYLPVWYASQDLALPEDGVPSALPQLYRAAYRTLASMPGPKSGTGTATNQG